MGGNELYSCSDSGCIKCYKCKKVGTPQNWDTENKTELPSSVMDTYTYNIAELLENVKAEFNEGFMLMHNENEKQRRV